LVVFPPKVTKLKTQKLRVDAHNGRKCCTNRANDSSLSLRDTFMGKIPKFDGVEGRHQQISAPMKVGTVELASVHSSVPKFNFIRATRRPCG